jgi:hypothetical protein
MVVDEERYLSDKEKRRVNLPPKQPVKIPEKIPRVPWERKIKNKRRSKKQAIRTSVPESMGLAITADSIVQKEGDSAG